MNDYVYRNSVVGITTSGKDVQRNLKCGKRSVDLYRADWTVDLM